MRTPSLFVSSALVASSVALASSALAQTAAVPPSDVAVVVNAPKPIAAPKPIEPATDTTNAAISAGGQYAAGNSKLFAGSVQAKFDMRRGANAFAAAVVGNYAESYFLPPGSYNATTNTITPGGSGSWYPSTENLQAKLRYDRFITSHMSLFLQVSGLNDAFQAIVFRLNIDPGLKYLVVDAKSTKLWGEVGYDFQADDNHTVNGFEQQPGSSGPVAVDASGLPYVIHGSDTIDSARLFAGLQHAFNDEVTLNAGLEYVQGLGGSGGGAPPIPGGINPVTKMLNVAKFDDPAAISLTASRLNFNALFAAHLFGGLSVGLGFNVKYNSAPLPGKVNVDSAGTLSLIYAYSDAKKKEEKKCPCPPDAPPNAAPEATAPLAPPAPPPPPAAPAPAPPPAAAPLTPAVSSPPATPPATTQATPQG